MSGGEWMTVADLIAELARQPQDAKVMILDWPLERDSVANDSGKSIEYDPKGHTVTLA